MLASRARCGSPGRPRQRSSTCAVDWAGSNAQLIEQRGQHIDAGLFQRPYPQQALFRDIGRHLRKMKHQPYRLAHQAAAAGAALARIAARRGALDADPQQLGDAFRRALEAERLRQPLGEQAPVDALRHLQQQWPRGLRHLGAAVRAAGHHPLAELAHEVLRQRQRLGLQPPFEGLPALLADQRVRILAFGQEQEAQLAALDGLRQRVLQRAARPRPVRPGPRRSENTTSLTSRNTR